MITDQELLDTLHRMPPEMRMMFNVLPLAAQEAYLTWWGVRPDPHAAHRDTLPAFMAGLFTGLS
jgi:hypothetical protein